MCNYILNNAFNIMSPMIGIRSVAAVYSLVYFLRFFNNRNHPLSFMFFSRITLLFYLLANFVAINAYEH